MVMDPPFTEYSVTTNGFKFDHDSFIPTFDQSENPANIFIFKDDPVDLNSMDDLSFLPTNSPNPVFVAPMSSRSSEVDSPDDSDDLLKYINSILMEENMEQKLSMFHDPLALQATEKSLYDVIGEKYPASANERPLYFNQNVQSPDYLFGSSSEQSTNSNTSRSNSIDSQWIVDPGEHKPPVQSYPLGYPFETTLQTASQLSFGSLKSFGDDVNGSMDSSMSSHLVSNIFSDSQSILQFKRGVEEASKFLPTNNQLIIDFDGYALLPGSEERASEVVVKVEDGGENSPNGSRGRKNHHREDSDLEEERSSKQSAVYVDESELSEMFDRVLLCTDMKGAHACCNGDEEVQTEATKTSQQNGQPYGSSGAKIRAKKQGNKNEMVDLRTLLINCAQSVAADDRRTANEQLKQIRQHATPSGDGPQRVAYIFANGLEARLAGTGSQIYAALASKRITAAEKLKAYQLYISACPFQRKSMYFAHTRILDLIMKSNKKKLHIIDFGILYGFQWPMLIQYLSTLPGGAPELRITGIELPQPGFRPAELVEETGRRLENYCERFNVRFQYHAIAKKWETVKIEDLNIHNDEMLAVNCLFRFRILPDETVDVDSPRDVVLKLIRKMNPDIFIHSVINGSHNAPFFVNRFREALFHYSSLFDMFDTNISREGQEGQERMHLEREFYGREIMNIIACEGPERVERPETYKQWQARNARAGFKILPLDPEVLKKFKGKVKARYHKDFVIDEDGQSQWMLQGWKGRIFCASSCWVPA